jgi:hypothetical protein
MSNIEVMYSVYYKKDRAKRFHPSTFCGSIFYGSLFHPWVVSLERTEDRRQKTRLRLQASARQAEVVKNKELSAGCLRI